MPHETDLILTLTGAFALALAGGLVASKLHLPPIVGYLMAGIALGPFTPGYTADQGIATQLAEIGIILLMFGVGVHFSLKELGAVRNLAILGALGQSTLATGLGILVSRWWGWPLGAGMVLGLSISVASTVVLLRALSEEHLLESFPGRVAVAWLVVEDLLTVGFLVLLPVVAVALQPGFDPGTLVSEGLLLTLGVTLLKVLAFVAVMMLVGARAVPWLLEQVARIGSRELFTLAVLAIALGIAVGASLLFGVSLALGAFVAGLVISESDLSHQAATDALPLRDAFAVLFFVSVGMLFNPFIVVTLLPETLAVLAIVVLGKPLAAIGISLALGHPLRTGLVVAAGLAQVGEFSFILADLGRSLDLLPETGYHVVLAVALISITANPFLFRLLPALQGVAGRLPARAPAAPVPEAAVEGMRGHAVILGFNAAAPLLVEALGSRSFRLLVVDDNRRRVEALRKDGLTVVYGDPTRPLILEQAHLAGARTLIVLLDDPLLAAQATRTAKAINPQLDIVAIAHGPEERQELERAGATETVLADLEVGLEVTRHTLRRFGVENQQIQLLLQRFRQLSG